MGKENMSHFILLQSRKLKKKLNLYRQVLMLRESGGRGGVRGKIFLRNRNKFLSLNIAYSLKEFRKEIWHNLSKIIKRV